eukprot:6338186-Prymnesium_polylepis.1
MHDPVAGQRQIALNLRERWCGCAAEGFKGQLHGNPLALVDVAPGLEGESRGAAKGLASVLVHAGEQHTVGCDRDLLPRCDERRAGLRVTSIFCALVEWCGCVADGMIAPGSAPAGAVACKVGRGLRFLTPAVGRA